MGTCNRRNNVYENVCKLYEAEGQKVRYLGETARAIWERNLEHQKDALTQKNKSHMREHMTKHHPEHLMGMLDIFIMKRVKALQSALSMQIREAVEIGADTSNILLNDKVEYNRYLLPSLQVVGPPPIRVQLQQDSQVAPLSVQEEEAALSVARIIFKKRVREEQDDKVKAS